MELNSNIGLTRGIQNFTESRFALAPAYVSGLVLRIRLPSELQLAIDLVAHNLAKLVEECNIETHSVPRVKMWCLFHVDQVRSSGKSRDRNISEWTFVDIKRNALVNIVGKGATVFKNRKFLDVYCVVRDRSTLCLVVGKSVVNQINLHVFEQVEYCS